MVKANLKILYAAGNVSNAKIQLSRFLNAIDEEKYQIKIAAFKNSSPKGKNIDFTLNCIEDLFSESKIYSNEYLDRYTKLVKLFSPDLIISDLEFYSSQIGKNLGIPVWQCSSTMINYGVEHNYFQRKEYQDALFGINKFTAVEREKKILKESSGNYIYSHFGDLKVRPKLRAGYQWIRPYHYLGENADICYKNIIAIILNNNKNLLSFLKEKKDIAIFSDFDVRLKNINNIDEYTCVLKNSDQLLTEGQTSILSDAYYNGKFSFIIPNKFDPECISNAWITEKMKLGKVLFQKEDFEKIKIPKIIPSYRSDVHYLHQKLELI